MRGSAVVGCLLWSLATTAPARADEPAPPPAEPAPPPADDADDDGTPTSMTRLPSDPREALAVAITSWQDGLPGLAKDQLQAILAIGPKLDPEVRSDTLAYLGDILLSEGGAAPARSTFETLLDGDPDYVMDPLQHAPEVCSFFEDLRLARASAAGKRSRRPFPWLALVPGGLYYYTAHKPVLGVVVGGLQVSALVANVVMYSQLQSTDLIQRDDVAGGEAFTRLTVATDVTAGVAWLSWIVPASVEVTRWATPPPVTVGVGPGTVQLTATF